MKICVVSSTVFKVPLGNYGGLEYVSWQLAKGLAEKGHEVALVAPDSSECKNCKIIPVGPAGMVSEEQAWSGFPEIKDGDKIVRPAHRGYWQDLLEFNDGGVIIDHSWSKYSYLLKIEEKLKAPILGVMHAPVATMYQKLPPVDKPCFVCISDDQRMSFEALFNRQARTAYNGIDLNHYKPIQGVKRTNRFLFLARFSTIKSPDMAIQACKAAGVGLDLVGDAQLTQEPEFFQKCKRMCDGEQIRMVGSATRGETVWWYSQAHAMIHPNQRFREPFGLAPVEAMACGLPVLSWNYGAMKETVKNGASGQLVNSMEELVETIKVHSRGISQSYRESCREVASHFSVENMVGRYEDLCYEALNSGGW